jgi:Domain of unknown function (DUF4397)
MLLTAPAPSAAAAEPGLLRIAHLSPDTPAVDVSVTASGGAAAEPLAAHAGYGTVSGYRSLPPGTYAVALRPAGAPASAVPVLSTSVQLRPGAAATVAAVGRFADLHLQVLGEDLSSPPSGRARARVVDASAGGPLDVAVAGGPVLASGLSFPGVSAWSDVPGGTGTVRVGPAGGAASDVPVDLPAGAVVTLLVLDSPGGGLSLRPLVDAAGPASIPSGAVPAGGGGTAGPSPLRAVAGGLCIGAVVVLGALAARRRRG